MSDWQAWMAERQLRDVECFVADFAGVARGKLEPVDAVGGKPLKLPIAIFGQTVTGNFYLERDNLRDRDMKCVPDLSTLRAVPWASQPTASVLLDCFDTDGTPVACDPRAVLKRVLSLYAERGWRPVVAPEVEFYLDPADHEDTAADVGRNPAGAQLADPYGVDKLHELAGFFDRLEADCAAQEIAVGAVSQELGPGQFEVNFRHGDALRVADDVLHFKRTLKHRATALGLRASFLAKVAASKPGSSLHIHQSVYDANGANVFSAENGSESGLFRGYLAGLQTYMPEVLLLFAPYANSYRRFHSVWSSPANLEWGVDNRTVGLRVPVSAPADRRVENRLAGSDVNPYLAIAGTLACGYLGMLEELEPRAPAEGSAYEAPFELHRHFYESLDALRASEAMAEILGADFVRIYAATKEREFRDFEARIPAWEQDELGLLV